MAARLLARAASSRRRIRASGQGRVSAVPQCHIQTGYSTSRASVRRAATAAARPTASWSGWPSWRQGAASSVRAAGDPIAATSAATSASSRAASEPSARPRHHTRIPGRAGRRPASSSPRRRSARAAGSWVGEAGWEPSPAVAETTSDLPARNGPPVRPGRRRPGSRRRGGRRPRPAGRRRRQVDLRQGVLGQRAVPGRRRACPPRRGGRRSPRGLRGIRAAGRRGRPGRARRATGARRARGRRRGVRGPRRWPAGRDRARAPPGSAPPRPSRPRPGAPAGRTGPPSTPSSRPASMAAAASTSAQRAACSRASTAPRCMRATWSGSRPPVAAASIRRATPTAPPYQTAATPRPPQAKPGRSRYQPASPTTPAGTASRSSGPESTSARPRATQVPATAATPGWCRSTSKSRRSSPTQALMRARSRWPASEHQCLRPESVHAVPPWVPCSGVPGPSAAYTPQAPGAGSMPAWPRIARASRCGSSTRATVRSVAPSVASADQRWDVEPAAGSGSVTPTSEASTIAAGTSAAAARARSARDASASRRSSGRSVSSTGRAGWSGRRGSAAMSLLGWRTGGWSWPRR